MEIESEDHPQSSTEVEPATKSRIKKKTVWVGIICLVLAVIAVVVIVARRGEPNAERGELAGRVSDRSPGSEALIYVQGRDSLLVAADERALDELMSEISNRGDAQSLIQAGRVFAVPSKTRVRIVESGFAKMKVRILEGEKIMQEVWVPERWVR